MKIQNAAGLFASVCLLAAPSLIAQGRGGRGGGGGGGASVPSPTSSASFNAEQVARGEKAFAAQCGSCHGANARGGKGKTEVDLLRSPMVLDDLNGREIGEFLKYGRPEKNMPKFDLPQSTVEDMAAFLHRQIVAASERGSY
ncbi:MAG TPA: cytochrome c, partial [Bryobacteraceae bacterium]|nr:cytochrome c [Bryobacteraceae bacterium]